MGTTPIAVALDAGQGGHDLGARTPRVLFRRIECTQGSVDIVVEFAAAESRGRSGDDRAARGAC